MIDENDPGTRDMFEDASGPHSHHNAPPTSAKAAEKFKAQHGSIRERVYNASLTFPNGFTDEDLVGLGKNREHFERSIRPRRTELANERWLIDTGREEKVKGNDCRVWINRGYVENPPPLQPKGRPQAKVTAAEERAAIVAFLHRVGYEHVAACIANGDHRK